MPSRQSESFHRDGRKMFSPTTRLLTLVLCLFGTGALAQTLTTAATTAVPCHLNGTDLVLILDKSGSMKYDIATAVDALADFVKGLNIGPTPYVNSRIGFVRFDSIAYVDFNLTVFNSSTEAAKRIMELTDYGGGTSIESGMNAAALQIFNATANYGNRRMAIVITDGYNGAGVDPIRAAAQLLRGLGVVTYAFGVGATDLNQLVAITGSWDRVVTLSNWTTFESYFSGECSQFENTNSYDFDPTLTASTSTPPSTPAPPTTSFLPNATAPYVQKSTLSCQVNCAPSGLWLDIVIAVDTTASEGTSNDQDLAGTILTTIDGIVLDASQQLFARIGLIAMGGTAQLVHPLGYYNSTQQLLNDLLELPEDTADNTADIVGALNIWRNTSVNAPRGANYRQVLLIYSATSANCSNTPPESSPVCQVANRVQNDPNVRIISIGLKSTVDGQVAHVDLNNGDCNQFSAPGLSIIADTRGALCTANCFCPYNDYAQVQGTTKQIEYCNVYAECIRMASSPASYGIASELCQHAKHTTLSNTFDAVKHDFLQRYVSGLNGQYYPYYLGATGQLLYNLTWNSGDTYNYNNDPNWWSIQPSNSNNITCPTVSPSGLNYTEKWFVNSCSTAYFYLCQARACIAGNVDCLETKAALDGHL